MTNLDMTRPYITVLGPGISHKYVQDGKKFDVAGKQIGAKYLCDQCGFVAKTKAGLDAHVRAKHNDSEPEEEAQDGLERGGPPWK